MAADIYAFTIPYLCGICTVLVMVIVARAFRKTKDMITIYEKRHIPESETYDLNEYKRQIRAVFLTSQKEVEIRYSTPLNEYGRFCSAKIIRLNAEELEFLSDKAKELFREWKKVKAIDSN